MRAIWTAVSLASVPLFDKKLQLISPGVIWAIFSASATTVSLGKTVEACCRRSTWALIFEVTRGDGHNAAEEIQVLVAFHVPDVLHAGVVGDQGIAVIGADGGEKVLLILFYNLIFCHGGAPQANPVCCLQISKKVVQF